MHEIKNMIKPKKLQRGDHIRVIAPVRSLAMIGDECREIALNRFAEQGFRISFGKHVYEMDEFFSSSIESRIQDLHDAFADETVDAVFTVIGGYNSNQLLSYIDYDLLARNPKIFCGFSDVTVLANAITAMTGMITYLGPHFSSWGMRLGFEYSLEYFLKCCTSEEPYVITPSKTWSDDLWFSDQVHREFISNEGYWMMNPGHAVGRIVGGHVRCLAALQGTKFWPGLSDSILVLEEDEETGPRIFDRLLQSLIHQPEFSEVQGILVGRFQKKSGMTREILHKILSTKKELHNIPIVANVDVGHTTPQMITPIGGSLEMLVKDEDAIIKIIEH